MYFCDPAYEPQAPAITESFLGRLKRLTDERGLPWSYAPLHRHLSLAADEGRFPKAAAVD